MIRVSLGRGVGTAEYASDVALTEDQLTRGDEIRKSLAERSPEENLRVAAWLRSLIPDLEETRARAAERIASDFEAQARNPQMSRSSRLS